MIGTLLLARLRAVLPLAVQAAGQAVLQQAQQNVASDSGTLARSLVLDVQEKTSADGAAAHISTPLPYAQLVELGSARRAPQPFLRPALLDQRSQMAGHIRTALAQTPSQESEHD